MSGFIALHREAREHPLFAGDAQRFGAWFWLVATACWKPTKFNAGGTIITLERGQLCVSRTQLATAWGMSPSAVERFLTRLQTEQMIGRSTGQARSIITICNYDTYQGQNDEAGQPTGQRPDSDRTTKEQWNKGTIVLEEPNGSPKTAHNAFPRPEWADAQVWSDFLKNRKTKRLSNTATAYKRFTTDIAALADPQWPPGRLLEAIVARGWGAVFDPRPKQGFSNDRPNQPPRNNRPSDEPLNPFVRAAAERQAERAAHGAGQSGGWPDHGDGFEGMAGGAPD